MAKFLDENGVKKLWSRIQEYVYECCCSKGGGDVGYECKGGSETLWQGSVEADEFGRFPYTKQINADKLLVTFDNAVYECEKIVLPQINGYGGFDNGEPNFSKYPFAIVSGIIDDNAINELYVKDSGIHTLKIEADNTIITTTECFQKAVKSVGDSGYKCTTSFEEAFSESGATEVQKTSDTPSTTTLAYTGFIDADEIKVVFNGTEYTCPKTAMDEYAIYGSAELSFTDYPFAIGFSKSHGNVLQTKDPMDFTVEVDVPVTTAIVTPCFETAVKTAMGGSLTIINAYSKQDGDCTIFTLDKTGEEILEILQSGGNIAINISPQESSMDLYFPYSMRGTDLAPIKTATLTAQNKTATPLKAKPMGLIIDIISPDIEEKFVKWQFSAEYLEDYPSYTYCTK